MSKMQSLGYYVNWHLMKLSDIIDEAVAIQNDENIAPEIRNNLRLSVNEDGMDLVYELPEPGEDVQKILDAAKTLRAMIENHGLSKFSSDDEFCWAIRGLGYLMDDGINEIAILAAKMLLEKHPPLKSSD